MTATICQMVRVEQQGRYWLVLVLSPVSGWIVQGEHLTREAADRDARTFTSLNT